MRSTLAALALLGALLAPQASLSQVPASAEKKKMTPPPPAAPRPFEFPKYSSRKLANGLTVFVIEDHRMPLVSYSLQVLAGNINLKPEHSGVASMTAELLREGTTTRTSQQIAELVDTAGGNLAARAGDDFTTVSGTFMKSYADLGLELLADIVLNPKFDQEEIDRHEQQALSGLSISYNNPEYLRPLLSARSIYGTHPYAYPGDGTPKSLQAITRDQIVGFYKNWYAPSRAYLAISGDVTAEQAFAQAEKYLGSWKTSPSAMPQIAAPPAPRAQVVVLDKPDAVQTQIGVGHLGVARNHPDYLALQIAAQIFSGSFNSRLNMKLRAAEGLTYGAGGGFQSDKLAGLFNVGTFTRTEKTADAIRMILDLVKEWKANPATGEELNEAKAFLAGSYGLALETADAVAVRVLYQQLYDLAPDYYTRFRENVLAMTKEKVVAAVQRHVQPDKLTIVAVGNAKEFAKSLEAFGPVRIIPLADFDPLSNDMLRAKESVVASADGAAKGKALIDGAAAAMGGKDKLLALKDLTIKGNMKLNTPQGTLDATSEESILYPDKYKSALTMMGMNILQVFDGTTGYMAQGPNSREVPAEIAKEMGRSALTAAGVGLLRAALSGEAEVVGLAPVEIDGKPANAALWKRDGLEMKIFADPASGLIRKLSFRALGMQGPADVEVSFDAYKPAAGLNLPTVSVVTQNGTKFAERTISAYETNTGLTPDAFKKPAQ